MAEELVNQAIEGDPKWDTFQKLLNTPEAKTYLMSFTELPSWLIDGGLSAEVTSTYKDRYLKITVPTKIYRAYLWKNTIDSLKKTSSWSEETLQGTDATKLARDLSGIATFLKENKKI